MKKIIFAITLISSILCYSQKPTSVEEYNYLTKGYKIQIDSGLDMKSGYSLVNILNQKVGDDTYEFKVLKKDSYLGIRGILIIAKPAEYGQNVKFYFCIPVGNNELYNQFIESIRGLGKQTKENLLIATTIALNNEVVKNYRSPDKP